MGDSELHGPGWWLASDGQWYPPAPEPPTLVPALFPPPTLPVETRIATSVYVSPTGYRPQTSAGKATSTVGNLLWLVLAGFWLAIGYVIAGLFNMITIIGIPFGIQSFKLAGYALWPFGRMVVERPGQDAGLSCLGNVIWFFFGGFWLAIAHVLLGLLLCLTIVGIPLGLGCFKMASLAIAPFGKQIVSRSQLARMGNVVVVSTFE